MPKINIKKWFQKGTIIRIILIIAVQSFLSLLFDVFGLGAGSIGSFTFLSYASTFPATSAFIILFYPPILSSDGGIGVLVSRLGTALNIGSIKPQFFKNNEYFYTIISAVLTLGSFNGLLIGLVSYITNLISLGQQRIINPVPFITIPILTLTLSSFFSTQIASFFSFFLYKKGLNPDVWVYPTMSTINNIFSTLLYSALIAILQPVNWFNSSGEFASLQPLTYFILLPFFAYLGFIVFLLIKNIKKKQFRSILKEAIPIQSITLTINSLTGGILSKADVALRNLRGLFLIYPALIDTLGDECTIIANTTSTNLNLGLIEPKLTAIKDKDLWTHIIGVWLAGFGLHLIYGIFGSIIVGDFGNIGIVLGLAILINLLSFLVVEFLVYFLLIFSYKLGL
ncbi:MAG: magnesium transporter, partial [Asgard group archaeon]|nr:magnesium transporter [Asgard group archaeon]